MEKESDLIPLQVFSKQEFEHIISEGDIAVMFNNPDLVVVVFDPLKKDNFLFIRSFLGNKEEANECPEFLNIVKEQISLKTGKASVLS